MEVGVEVRWPGNRRSGWFTTRHPRCSYNTPILVFDGAARRPSELAPDIEVIVPWIAKFGPEWGMIQKAIDAGYPIKMESTEE